MASSLNPLDYKARTGELRLLMRAKPPKVLGGDFSGTISALGAGVTGFAIGDEVFGCVDEFTDARGSHAEYCVVPATALSRKPAGVPHEQAASLTMAGVTAWQALTRHAGLKAGRRLLVLGGSGGVGSAAVQLGKALGAHVTATAGAANAGRASRSSGSASGGVHGRAGVGSCSRECRGTRRRRGRAASRRSRRGRAPPPGPRTPPARGG